MISRISIVQDYGQAAFCLSKYIKYNLVQFKKDSNRVRSQLCSEEIQIEANTDKKNTNIRIAIILVTYEKDKQSLKK